MLFGTLLFLGAAAVSAIKCSSENSYFKQKHYTMPNGTKYYFDRLGKTRLVSNDKLVFNWGDKWVDDKYNVICDSAKINNDNKVKELIAEAKRRGKKAYQLYNKKKYKTETIEISTGRPIVTYKTPIRKTRDDFDSTTEWVNYREALKYPLMYSYRIPYEYRKYYEDTNSPSVEISKEEYEALTDYLPW